jgi:hypothetical protein
MIPQRLSLPRREGGQLTLATSYGYDVTNVAAEYGSAMTPASQYNVSNLTADHLGNQGRNRLRCFAAPARSSRNRIIGGVCRR